MVLHYLMQEDEKLLTKIPNNYRQTFQYPFSVTSVSRKGIIKMKMDGTLTSRDVDISLFLFQHRFATTSQICDYLDNEFEYEAIASRLEKLVKYRVINRFCLSETELTNVPHDAMYIYTLDFGGKYLIAQYTGEDTSTWISTDNGQISENVAKELILTDYYLQLKKSINSRLVSFKKNPAMRVAGTNIQPSLMFSYQYGVFTKYIICEICRSDEVMIGFRERIQKEEELFTTNAWRKYCVDSEEPPILFVIADDDMTARDAGRVVNRGTEISAYRMTTFERFHKHFGEKGAFLKYLPDEDVLKPVSIRNFKNE